jgi:hypothetical protein
VSSGNWAEGEGEMIDQPWTPADDERLRKLAGEGRTTQTIAESLKRSSAAAVRRRAKHPGVVLAKAKEE